MNVELCEELGANIYSFPMKYHPINDKDYFKIEILLENTGTENLYAQFKQYLILQKEKLVKVTISLKKPLEKISKNFIRFFGCQKPLSFIAENMIKIYAKN